MLRRDTCLWVSLLNTKVIDDMIITDYKADFPQSAFVFVLLK